MLFKLGKLAEFFKTKGKMVKLLNSVEKFRIERKSDEIFWQTHMFVTAKMREKAMAKGVAPFRVIIRDLIPQDLKKFDIPPTWKWKLHEGWNAFNGAMEVSRFVAIQGFLIPPKCPITQIRLTTQGRVVRYWHVEGLEGPVFITDPRIMNEGKNFEIEFFSTKKATVSFPFFGTVVEEEGWRVMKGD